MAKVATKDYNIIWLSSLLTMTVPDEAYSWNGPCTLD